jgi:hypothetical protein
MRYLVLTLAVAGAVTAARAQDTTPDLKGTWSGKGKSIVFGHNPHHPGSETVTNPPRVRDFEFRGRGPGRTAGMGPFLLQRGENQRAVCLGNFGR